MFTTLSDPKIQIEVIPPPEKGIALAYIKLNTSQLTDVDLRPHSNFHVKTSTVRAVMYNDLKTGTKQLGYSEISPPSYAAYIRHHKLTGEIIAIAEQQIKEWEAGVNS